MHEVCTKVKQMSNENRATLKSNLISPGKLHTCGTIGGGEQWDINRTENHFKVIYGIAAYYSYIIHMNTGCVMHQYNSRMLLYISSIVLNIV